jgi:LysR family transcriptional regulator, glycine cleavage system transcriptional activator
MTFDHCVTVTMHRTLPPIALLRAFEACARHLSVSRAAEELHLTQSAVSRQVAALETLLNLKLFRRVHRRLTPTLAGAAYVPEVRGVLSGLETATLELMAHGGAGGTLNLSVVPTFGTRWLVPRLPRFLEAHPNFMLNVQNFETRPRQLDFAAEHVHAAIWYGEAPWPGTHGLRLLGEQVVPVCAPQLARAGMCAPDALGEGSELPVCWTEVYINREFAAVGRLLQRHRGPIFHLIEDLFGQSLVEVHQEIAAALISPALARGLKVKAGATALEVQRTYKLAGGKIAQVAINTHPASRFRHSMTMRRVKGHG